MTSAPLRVLSWHFPGHLIPAGELVIVPPSGGFEATLSVGRLAEPAASASVAVARARTPTSHASRIAEILRRCLRLGKSGLLARH